ARDGDVVLAHSVGETALAKAREGEHPLTVAESLALLARTADAGEADALLDEAIAVWRSVGHDREADAAQAERSARGC
ncbi:MAG: hypothetical protein Q8K63_15485, partial [Acidimicrobiales bacterium]|nr:hypothetical protein [Acidimicrobiales bacterium]